MSRAPETQEELEAVAAFRTEVCARSVEIDPSEERDWYELSIGWFLGRGLAFEAAEEMALFVRYACLYWTCRCCPTPHVGQWEVRKHFAVAAPELGWRCCGEEGRI